MQGKFRYDDERRDWMRFAIRPAAPAATSSGVGIEDGLSELTVPASPPFPFLPGCPLVDVVLVVVVAPP